ncbi:MAG: NADH-quinone oxidoreductase subunit I [Spirochaetia bacterium]|jgi:NADH-quinone oxidoreductase subunit I
MARDVVEILKAVASLPRGLWITFQYLFRKPITIQYPEEKAVMALRFRGRLVLPVDPQKGTNRCTACMRCVTICPNHSIDIEPETGPDGAKQPRPARYLYNLGTCMFCNLCVETCPFFAIVMSDEYELATTEKSGLLIDLVKEKYRLSGKKAGWWQRKFRSAADEE